MPKFRVVLTQKVYEEARVTVEAATAAEAERIARQAHDDGDLDDMDGYSQWEFIATDDNTDVEAFVSGEVDE